MHIILCTFLTLSARGPRFETGMGSFFLLNLSKVYSHCNYIIYESLVLYNFSKFTSDDSMVL